jgi:ABC-type glycerol-3-phosphate transport system substrate-binding protein
MVRTKKLVSMLLVLSMLLLMAACGGTQKVGTETTTPTATATPEPTQSATATPEPEPDRYPAFDFGGRTIKVGIWWDYFYTSAHKSINDDPGMNNALTAQMRLDNVRRIEQKYNCRIEYVNLGWEGIINSINTSIAAGTPDCDLYLTDLQFGIPAVLNGLAQDLTKVAPANSDLFNEQIIFKPLDALGGTYLFTEQGLPQSGIYMGYNATMIEELGLEQPRELYKKGQWNWEKFAEYAKKGIRDNDGDGVTDVYGYGGVFTDFVNGLVMNNGGSIAGSKTEGLSSKPVMEALEFINRLYNVDKSARPWTWEDWNDNLLAWSDGKVMFWTAQAWLNKQEIDAAAADGGSLPFEFHVVPYPTGPSGDGKAYSPVQGNWYMIPVGVKDADKVFQIFEEFMNWHQGDTDLRDDPTWFESCFLDDEDVELAYMCGSNLKVDLWNSLNGFDFGATIWSPIVVDKTSTPAQAVEAAKPVLQDALNNAFK